MRRSHFALFCALSLPFSSQEAYALAEVEGLEAEAEVELDRHDLEEIESAVEDVTAQVAAQIKEQITAQVAAHKKMGSKLSQSKVVQTVSELHLAVANNQYELAEKLLARGADPDEPSPMQNLSPLHSAAEGGHKDIVDLLLFYNATIDTRGISDVTPLHLAAHKGRVSVVELLLRNGAPVDALMSPSFGYSPLFMAADMGHTRVVTLLLVANASTELRDSSGRTALHAAAAAGHEGVVVELLEHHAYVDARDNSGVRPILMATSRQQPEVCSLRGSRRHRPALDETCLALTWLQSGKDASLS